MGAMIRSETLPDDEKNMGNRYISPKKFIYNSCKNTQRLSFPFVGFC